MGTVVIPYRPRKQFVPFHQRTERWAVLVVHRRGGKTVAVINDLIKRALECQLPSPRFAYVAPTYGQAKDVAWQYLKRFVAPIPGVIVSEGELHVTLPGDRRIRLYGADNYDRLRGIYLDGLAVDESADMAPEAWSEVLRPALSDRKGWAVWIGTPKGRDAFYKIWRDAQGDEEFYSLLLPASKSGLIDADELKSARHAPGMTQAVYDQEYECSFDAPTPGAIYSAEIVKARLQGRISDNTLHFAQLPAYTAFDIGAPLNQRCWIFQAVGDRINLLESLSGSEDCATPAAWVKRLKDKVHYNWGGHFLPHDGETLWLRLMQEAGMAGVVVLPRVLNEWDNINDALSAFGRCCFNKTGTADGVDSLESYRSKEENDGITIRNTPVHDWASHYSTAFGYVHQAIRLGMLVDRSAMPRKPSHGKPVVHAGVSAHGSSIQRKVRILR